MNGYAFIFHDEKTYVVNLNDMALTATLDQVGKVLQTSVYDIKVCIVQAYWQKNKEFVEDAKTCDIVKRIHKDGVEEMRLTVFRSVLRKGIFESVAAEIAGPISQKKS